MWIVSQIRSRFRRRIFIHQSFPASGLETSKRNRNKRTFPAPDHKKKIAWIGTLVLALADYRCYFSELLLNRGPLHFASLKKVFISTRDLCHFRHKQPFAQAKQWSFRDFTKRSVSVVLLARKERLRKKPASFDYTRASLEVTNGLRMKAIPIHRNSILYIETFVKP